MKLVVSDYDVLVSILKRECLNILEIRKAGNYLLKIENDFCSFWLEIETAQIDSLRPKGSRPVEKLLESSKFLISTLKSSF